MNDKETVIVIGSIAGFIVFILLCIRIYYEDKDECKKKYMEKMILKNRDDINRLYTHLGILYEEDGELSPELSPELNNEEIV